MDQILDKASNQFCVDKGNTASVKEIVEFLKVAYSDQFNAEDFQDKKEVLKQWDWANLKNPNIQKGEFPAWFCKHKKTGEIVGHLGLIPVKIKIKNNYCRAAWGRNLIVSAKWRRSGIASFIFNTIIEKTKHRNTFLLIAGFNDYVASICKKLGFIHLGYIPLYIRILKVDGIIKQRLSFRVIASPLKIIINILIKIWNIPSGIPRHNRNKDILISEIKNFDASFDTLWERISSHYSIIMRRDSTNLNWRFVDQPYWKYKIFKAEAIQDGELLGYVILREGKSQGLEAGVVSDFFVRPDDTQTFNNLIDFIIRYFEKKKYIDLIRFDILNKAYERMLKKFCFIKIRSKSHFMVTNIQPGMDSKFILDSKNWFIDYADCDLDISGRR